MGLIAAALIVDGLGGIAFHHGKVDDTASHDGRSDGMHLETLQDLGIVLALERWKNTERITAKEYADTPKKT